MSALYERLTQYFLQLAEPYDLSDEAPSQHVWTFLRSHFGPLRFVIFASVAATILAASIEVWLIRYAGQIIDLLATHSPSTIWREQGAGLALAALVVLLLRPIAQFLRLAVNDISFQCNAATLVRWRAYDHLIKQSVGWFQEDLSGRTSSRLVAIGNHVSDSFHSALNAVAFGFVYMVGVVIMMAGVDFWLALPLFIWLGLYIAVLVWIIPKVVDAHHSFQSAKSALLGSVVDNFSNFDTMKLFAPRDQIRTEQRAKLEDTRQALFRTRQIGIGLRTLLITLEAVVMIGFIGYGVWLWSSDAATIGVVSATIALSLRITTMADWILDSIWWVFMRIGFLREALQTIGQPIAIPQSPNAPDLIITRGGIESTTSITTTVRAKVAWQACPSPSGPAKKSASSVGPALENPPWST